MTFDDDSLFLEVPAGQPCPPGRLIIPLMKVGLSWPPPEEILFEGLTYERESLSTITDKQREKMDNVMRGAVYKPRMN
jgi:hypothetical protein